MSAVPRWSHRDPVEGDNPFEAGDPRHAAWREATADARAALARHDDALAAAAQCTYDPQTYGRRLIELAAMRFDTWAHRGLAVADGDDAASHYATWLRTYVANWRAYVADTCPHVPVVVRDELDACLRKRATHWETQARHSPARRSGSGLGAPATSARRRPRAPSAPAD